MMDCRTHGKQPFLHAFLMNSPQLMLRWWRQHTQPIVLMHNRGLRKWIHIHHHTRRPVGNARNNGEQILIAAPAVAVAARFQPAANGVAAVQVLASQRIPLFFSGILTGRRYVDLRAAAIAARTGEAAISVGSRLVNVQGGLPGMLLSQTGGLAPGWELKKLVDDQLARGVSVEGVAIRRAISSHPVVKPIKVTAPNSVFALGNTLVK